MNVLFIIHKAKTKKEKERMRKMNVFFGFIPFSDCWDLFRCLLVIVMFPYSSIEFNFENSKQIKEL